MIVVEVYEKHYVNAWLKRCVFNVYLNWQRVCLLSVLYQEVYYRV